MNRFAEENEFVKLEKTVEAVLTENNLHSVLHFSKIQKHWPIIVGEPLAVKTTPAQLHKNKLIVIVEDAAYSHHLKYFERHILDLIASPEICGEGVVKKVVFKVGKQSLLKSIQKGEPEKEQKTDRKKTEIREAALETSKTIADKKLKASFARLMSHRISKHEIGSK